MARKKTVLVVVAHADDMEFTSAGTVARMTQELGYDVYQYILTDNSRGSYRLPPEELAVVSEQEAVAAGEILGLKEVRFERYVDGDLNQENPRVLQDKIMAMIREVKADIVMSWDPFAPYEDHPDHRMVSMATLDAASFSGNPKFFPGHIEDPYPVTEAYWFAKHPTNADCIVDITSTIDKKIEALLTHDCQMVLTMDMLSQEAKALGLDLEALAGASPDAYKQLIGDGVRQHCAKIGALKGYAFGEQLRHEWMGMLASLIGAEALEQDFP